MAEICFVADPSTEEHCLTSMLDSCLLLQTGGVPTDICCIKKFTFTEQLTDFLNSGQAVLHPMQFGFRKIHSTKMAACYFIGKI